MATADVLLLIVAFLIALHVLSAYKPEVDVGAAMAMRQAMGSVVNIAFGHLQISVHLFSLPTIPWPTFVKKLMDVLRNIAFFSFADLSQP